MADRVIYARRTMVERLELDEAQAFIELNHRSGAVKEQIKIISLGLYHEGALVAVAQFSAPRTAAAQREWSNELLRLAFPATLRVVGGASKLIKAYMKGFSPADIFTYQDTTGEVTDVYEHCGFTLVRQERPKTYLVAPGKTLATATRKEALGLAYATRYGPDRILKTKLGEVKDTKTGKRKSNKQLFLEDLGWHEETTTGDRVYEWVNPDRTFYTYKITATDSDKYYYGVSHVKKANASREECLNDGYFGSGGGRSTQNKFSNWKRKHKDTIQKEVLTIHTKQAHAYAEEKILVGDSWLTDELCLNSAAGGRSGGLTFRGARRQELNCTVHGLVLHQGDSCLTCSSNKRFTLKECELHGMVKHTGNRCVTCVNSSYVEGECSEHGVTLVRKGKCVKCRNQKKLKVKVCPMHGIAMHIGEKCYKCIDQGYSKKECAIHGRVLHRGDSCCTCSANAPFSQQACPKHGEVTFRGNSCDSCIREKTNTSKECEVHGLTAFQGNTCAKCSSAKLYTKEYCLEQDKITTHRKGICISCQVASRVKLAQCEIHGMVKHQGNKCCLCVAKKAKETKTSD